MSIPTIGVGMLGYGFMGKVHTECYRQIRMYYDPWPADIRLVGVATAHTDSAQHAKEQAGYEFCTTDWHEVVEHVSVDVVNICTPNDQHHEQVLAAIAAGKHVYCDKPLATTSDEARDMTLAAEEAGIVNQMVQNNRFIPALRRAKQIVDDGVLGRPHQFRVAFLHSGSSDPTRPLGWKMQDGGTLHDLGAHVIDLLRWLWGDVAELTARRAIFTPERPKSKDSSEMVNITGDDAAWIMARMQNGAIGTIETTKVATGAEDEVRLELHGETGAIRFNLMEPNWLDVYDTRLQDGPFGGQRGFQRIATGSKLEQSRIMPPPKGTAGWLQFHLESLRSFVENAAAGEITDQWQGVVPTFRDGWACHEIFDAAERSDQSGAWEMVATV
jgi:predicted dehydrogenase